MIDGKAVMISDLLCDGLGACIGHCPQGAISIEKREAKSYDEHTVMIDIVKEGKNVVLAHLKHLKDHNEMAYLKQGIEYLKANNNKLKFDVQEILKTIEGNSNKEKTITNSSIHETMHHGEGCPGSKSIAFPAPVNKTRESIEQHSELTHWPIQLHLIQPSSSHFHKCDLLVAADCTAFSYAPFIRAF